MNRQRRWLAVLLLALALPGIAADGKDVFDPLAWLRARKLGKLTTVTPQSGKPLRGLAAATLEEWHKERALYQQAFRELIGPWPSERPPLKPA